MKIFCVGDVVSQVGRDILRKHINEIVKENDIALTVINGENLSHGRGMSRNAYDEMVSCGVDAFTLGNHTWDCKDITGLLMYNSNIIRPANFSPKCPGKGSMLLTARDGKRVGIINVIGQTYMTPCSCPFEAVERELKALSKETNIILVDFHAEATSEKQALGWFSDGKVSAVFGTHTHVQTADEMIMPSGTGYITDLGMTGAVYSVLGMERKPVIERFMTGMPQKFTVADGKGRLCGCIFDINDSGKTTDIKRINIM